MTEPSARIDSRVVTASALRLREQPALSSKALASLPRGTVVDVVETAGSWSRVTSARRVGWMASKYLAPRGRSATPVKPDEEFAWMPVALSELGVNEVPGTGNSLRVVEYLRSTELDAGMASDDATPWCSAFANWCVEHSGFIGTNSASARSWLHWGNAVTIPRRGCLCVLSRPGGGVASGHVGFFLGKTTGKIELLGGNQGDQVSVASYEASRLLGYRVPH